MNVSTLPALIQRFFTDRLTGQLEASPNTIAGYRDTFRLLLRYASQRRSKPPTKLKVEDLDAAFAIAPAAATRGLRRSDPSIAMWR